MYTKIRVHLSEGQIDKLRTAAKKGESVTLQIDSTLPPNNDLYLTETQVGQINKGKRITISKTQLRKTGGFLPFLVPALAALATGTLSGAAGWGTKKLLDKATGGDILTYITQHPLFKQLLTQALDGIIQKILPKKKGEGIFQNWEGRGIKKRCGKGVLQTWEYPTRT